MALRQSMAWPHRVSEEGEGVRDAAWNREV